MFNTVGRMIAVLCVLLVAQSCGSEDLVDILVSGAEVAITTLQSTGNLPAPLAATLNNYLNQAVTAADQVESERASSDTTAVQDSKIAAILANVVKPDLTGVPLALASVISAVATDVANLLTSAQTSQNLFARPEFANSFAGQQVKKLTSVSRRKANKIHNKIAELKAKLNKT